MYPIRKWQRGIHRSINTQALLPHLMMNGFSAPDNPTRHWSLGIRVCSQQDFPSAVSPSGLFPHWHIYICCNSPHFLKNYAEQKSLALKPTFSYSFVSQSPFNLKENLCCCCLHSDSTSSPPTLLNSLMALSAPFR